MHDYDIELSRGSMQQLAAYDSVVQAMTPLYGPCVAPPQPWVAPQRGCYALSHQQRFRVDLMRTKTGAQARALQAAHRAGTSSLHGGADDMMRGWTEDDGAGGDVAEPGLSRIYHSLNVLSSQAWSINSGVLEVRRHAQTLGPRGPNPVRPRAQVGWGLCPSAPARGAWRSSVHLPRSAAVGMRIGLVTCHEL